jgi:hypothetical protein
MQNSIINQIQNDPVIFWLVIAFAAVTTIQLIYYWGFFSRLAFYREPDKSRKTQPVSVVLTASNQYNDLKSNLDSFLNQDYTEFEVVVVIDNSDDGTNELLKDFSKKYENLHVVELKQKLNWFSGRKFPLSIGIKSAKYDHILLSDPACRPATKNWIGEMASVFVPGKEIAIGFSSFATNTRMNKWLRFTAFYDGLFYISMALSGIPFKGNGKNLSYSRNLFYQNRGFSSHYVVSVGDDELFVNRAATRSNVAVQISAPGKVNQVKAVSFLEWISSERSRLKIRRHFKRWHKWLIRGYSFTSFAFYALFVALLITCAPWLVLLPVFALRLASQMMLFGLTQKKLSEKKLLLLSPVFEVFLILIDFLIWISMVFGRKRKWT